MSLVFKAGEWDCQISIYRDDIYETEIANNAVAESQFYCWNSRVITNFASNEHNSRFIYSSKNVNYSVMLFFIEFGRYFLFFIEILSN